MDDKLKELIQSQTYKPSTSTQFYPRVVNKTNIHFSDDELGLLNKGLKYNLSKKCEHWISNLALEAETAVTLLPPGEQDYIRHQVAKNIKMLYQQNASCTHNDIKEKKEDKILKQIKGKLLKNKAFVTKADKGNSIVILYQDDYNKKVEDFISNNNFTITNNDITKHLQREIRSTINECQSVNTQKRKMEIRKLKPHSPDPKRPGKVTQRRHTHQAGHKLGKHTRIQTSEDDGKKTNLIHTPPIHI